MQAAYIFFVVVKTVAIYPKAECVLTTDAKIPTHNHRIFGVRLCVQHSLDYLSPTVVDEGRERKKGMQFNENAYTMHAHCKCHAVQKKIAMVVFLIQCFVVVVVFAVLFFVPSIQANKISTKLSLD